MSRLFDAARTALYMTGFVALWGWLAFSVRRFDARVGVSLPAWTPAAGFFLFVAGSAVALSCGAFFAFEGRGTPAPFDPPRVFVAAGPYRFVRNPMYLGGLAVLAGLGLILRSPSVLGLALCAAALVHGFVVLIEEPGLKSRFGENYLVYLSTTNRWLPRLRAVSG